MLNDQKLLRKRMQNARKLGNPDSALKIAKLLWETQPVSARKPVKPALELRDNILELLKQHKIHIPVASDQKNK